MKQAINKDTMDHIGKMPLEELIDAGELNVGQKVIFRYAPESGDERVFEGRLQINGIEVNGHLYSISYSAVYCMESLGDQKAINGWLAWQTEDGRFLAEVYQSYRDEVKPLHYSKTYTEKFYQYPSRRDVVFIFGAGASFMVRRWPLKK